MNPINESKTVNYDFLNKGKFVENFQEILNIQKIFIQAKKDNGETFLREIKKLNKNNLEKQLKYYLKNGDEVNKLRAEIVKLLLDGKEVNFEIIEQLKQKFIKENKEAFKTWNYFRILHSIYYFDKKDFIRNFLKNLANQLVKDLKLVGKVKIEIIDSPKYGFGFVICNKSYKSCDKALQLKVSTFDEERQVIFSDYKISIGLGKGKEFKQNVENKFTIVDLNDLTYDLILKELEKYKDIILEDTYNNLQTKPILTAMQTNNIQKLLQDSKQLLDSKKQIILYGPPGTGKTYNVKNIIENHSQEGFEKLKQDGKVEFVTFHQSFSYEEFIEGIRAETDENGNVYYEIRDGIFKEICERAKVNFKSSRKGTNIDIENLLEDFSDFVEEKGKLKIREGTFIEVKKDSQGNLRSFKTSGRVQGQHLTKDLIKRDLDKFLKGEIKKPNDIRPSRESKRNRHGNAIYYFALFQKIKDFLDNRDNNYFLGKGELQNYYLIIDEINRGNISKIFGELITLLEADKRTGEENEVITKLPYSKKDFSVPSNLYIVATMNTSDKSIVSLDTALRRRFGFVEVLPDYELLEETNIEGINLAELLKKINLRIEALLDKDHLIGHSYFLKVENLDDLKRVFYNEIIPLLEEYFYGEEEKIKKVLGSGFVEKETIDKDLFEDSEDFDENDVKYEIKQNLTNEEFVEALGKIINHKKFSS